MHSSQRQESQDGENVQWVHSAICGFPPGTLRSYLRNTLTNLHTSVFRCHGNQSSPTLCPALLSPERPMKESIPILYNSINRKLPRPADTAVTGCGSAGWVQASFLFLVRKGASLSLELEDRCVLRRPGRAFYNLHGLGIQKDCSTRRLTEMLPQAAKRAAGAGRGLLRRRGVAGPEWREASSQLTFATRPGSGSRDPPGSENPLKGWALAVSPFGQLRVRLPCHVSVSPLDPHQYPDANRAFVTVSRQNPSPHPGADLDDVHVTYDTEQKEMGVLSDDMDSTASVDVRIPVKFDLDIKTSGDGCVKIEKIECESCRIKTENGTSILQSIKSKNIDIQAKGGKVISLGTLQGNADIHVSQESSVDIEKLQGSAINISTKDGSLKTKYLYAESSFLSSTAGDILMGNVHGITTLRTKTGNITVDSSEGFLKASTYQGKIDVYTISQEGEVDLKSQNGSITVKVPATLKAYLHLSGSKIDVSPEVQLQRTQNVSREGCIMVTGHLNQREENEKYIKAETQNGTVYLKHQTWFQSVKLKTPP
ncbi:protein FAM185A [Heteronotia binoei]|uniref:protein FAM185A n=1 Tax=Heteronotia binoei TaxID=13085 RepID=UPI00292ECC87|nr:protein FAM185A [Heteronotia binoei]